MIVNGLVDLPIYFCFIILYSFNFLYFYNCAGYILLLDYIKFVFTWIWTR